MKQFLLYSAAVLLALSVSAQAPVKKVLIEEFTTASCGNCPFASLTMNQWHQAHEANSILIAIHEGSGKDSMSSTLTNTIFNAFHKSSGWFAPAVMIDRDVYPWVDSVPYLIGSKFGNNAQDTIAERIMNDSAVVGVDISGSYNATTRTITAEVTATFVKNVPAGDMRICLYLVEDSVVGTSGYGAFAYDQECYDGSTGTWVNTWYPGMGTFDTGKGFWYIMGYPHRHVLREALLTNAWGKTGVIPTSPVVGTNYSASATYTVPAKYNDKRLSVVGFVTHYGSGKDQKYVLNAEQYKIQDLTSHTSITKQTLLPVSINSIYPQPVKDEAHLVYTLNRSEKVQIELADIIGRTNKVLVPERSDAAGTHNLTFSTKDLAPGIYFVSVVAGGNRVTRKLIVE